jgi:phenylacetate-coenzyme A ligase PaaK-like adenylate-forming protein
MDLDELLNYCYVRSPFYQRKFSSLAGANSSSAAFIDAFQSIPPLLLQDMANPPVGGALRGRQTRSPEIIYQLEYDVPVFQGYSPYDLEAYVGVMSDVWHQIGVKADDRVAIYDYGSSPVTYLSSRVISPYLWQGAADRAGAVVICNDGLPELVDRCWHLLTYVQPQVLFMRCDNVDPFLRLLTRREGWPATPPRQIVVSGNEEWPDMQEISAWERALGTPVRRLARADLAMWLALECSESRIHMDSDRYLIEVVDPQSYTVLPTGEEGVLTITCLFGKTAPSIRYVSTIFGRLCSTVCSCGQLSASISLE